MVETVLTSRRAWVRTDGGTVAARLRLTDVRLHLATADRVLADLPLAEVVAVRLVRLPRAAVEVRTGRSTVRLRCFAPAAIAALIEGARPR